MNDRQAFREAAQKQGLPPAAIDWWLHLARPRLELVRDGDGPVVGRFGGQPALPEDVEWPDEMVHLATVDLSAISVESHDLDLPLDGVLVFFSQADLTPDEGSVIYLPSGLAAQERDESFPLYGRPGWTLPEERWQSLFDLGEPGFDEDALRQAVREVPAREDVLVAIGGYGDEATSGVGSPVEHPGEEILLAQTFMPVDLVGDRFGGSEVCILSFLISPGDLASRQFDTTWLFSDFLG